MSTSPATAMLAPRTVRPGAIFWIVGSLQFVVGMIVTQVGYPNYSITGNYISDLGAVNCGKFGGEGAFAGDYVCSPWHLVFNISIILLGIFLIIGAVLVFRALGSRGFSLVGAGLLIVAGIGAIGVGVFPEDVNLPNHILFATLAFAGSGLALVVLGIGMLRSGPWRGYGGYTIISGLVGLTALVLFLEKAYGPLGVGGMERLIVAPVLLWAIVAGIHLARFPTLARRVPPGPEPS
ncbi:MAG: DUF998 domain-containing protein [Thermoplasmata archaeon]